MLGSYNLLKYSFGILHVLYVNFSVKSLKFLPKCPFSYFQPNLAVMFVNIAGIYVKIIPDFYRSKPIEEISEKQL